MRESVKITLLSFFVLPLFNMAAASSGSDASPEPRLNKNVKVRSASGGAERTGRGAVGRVAALAVNGRRLVLGTACGPRTCAVTARFPTPVPSSNDTLTHPPRPTSQQLALWFNLLETASASVRSGDALSAYVFLVTRSNAAVGYVQGFNGIAQVRESGVGEGPGFL